MLLQKRNSEMILQKYHYRKDFVLKYDNNKIFFVKGRFALLLTIVKKFEFILQTFEVKTIPILFSFKLLVQILLFT